MSSQILQARQTGEGISFHFNFGKAPLSLRSVAIEDDGLPKLVFDAANCRDLPVLTEEDVATVVRLVTEGKRPEFFYTGCMNPIHPFFDYGRLYKYYSPQWLRGTSVGDLLSEADWSMKCLHVGTRSNASKTVFKPWQETSKLENLGVHMDFPQGDTSDRRVLMTCDHVKYEQSENEILFLVEPKMRITDHSNPMYTEYITEYFNNVAYHDEPLFLKMQELMKLVIAFEWMREKGIHFKEKWMRYHTEKKQQAVIKSTGIQPMINSEKIIQQVIHGFKAQVQDSGSPDEQSVTVHVKSVTKMATGAEIVMMKDIPESSEQQIFTIRLSINDYDFLYDGIDYRMPMTIIEEGKSIFPDVRSWSELYNETVPMPCAFGVFGSDSMEMVTGGVTTRNIPTRVTKVEKVHKTKRATTQVKASPRVISPSPVIQNVPQVDKVSPPPIEVNPRTRQYQLNKITREIVTAHGQMDNTGATFESGDGRGDVQTCKMSVKKETRRNGEIVSEDREFRTAAAHLKLTSKGGTSAAALETTLHLEGAGEIFAQLPTIVRQGDLAELGLDGVLDTTGDGGIFSPSDAGDDVSRFPFCSPIGSGDEMNMS